MGFRRAFVAIEGFGRALLVQAYIDNIVGRKGVVLNTHGL